MNTLMDGAPHFRPQLLFGHAWVVGFLIVLTVAFRVVEVSSEALVYPACVLFVTLSAWCLWSWKRQARTLFDPYTLFFAAAVLFNGGQVVLTVCGMNRGGLLNGRFSAQTTLATLFLLLIGLASLHLGALLSGYSRHRLPLVKRGRSTIRRGRALRLVGCGFLLASFTPYAAVALQSLRAVMSYGYFVGLFQQDAATGFSAAPNVLASLLVPGILLLLAGSEGHRSAIIACTLLVITHSGISLFMGSRAPAVAALAAFLWLWHRRIGRLNKYLITFIAVLLLALLPVIATVRNISGQHRSSAAPFVQALAEIKNPAVSLLSEMGYSINTVAYTIDLVPSVRPFDMGESYFYAFLTVFPNLFWEVHPTVAHGLLGDWLVWTVDPVTAAANGGLGFSFLAEAYLNFGWYGSPFALVLIGFLLGRLNRWSADSADPATSALAACVLYFVLIFARGESAGVVRGVVWYSLFTFLVVRLIARYPSQVSVRHLEQNRNDPQCAYR